MTVAVAVAVAVSSDGQWIAVRRDREIRLYPADDNTAVGAATLGSDDVDVAFVGPPITLIVAERSDAGTTVRALTPPELADGARTALDGALELVATTGPRLALLARHRQQLSVLRSSGRAFMTQPCEPGPVDLAVGLDRNQLLLVLPKKIEVWDAVSGRPLQRHSYQLPAPPRKLGAAAGHVWAARIGHDELIVYRLSDGRPFAHSLGSSIVDVVSHPASPHLVVVTGRGLVRLNCFAHTVEAVTAPDAVAFAIAVVGESNRLIGVPLDGAPWRVALGPTTAAAEPTLPDGSPATTSSVMERARSLRISTEDPVATASSVTAATTAAPPRTGFTGATGLDALATYGAELVRGGDAEAPMVPVDSTLGQLAQRLQLATPARRALTALYATHLAGDSGLSPHRLASAIGSANDGWREALAGELAPRGLVVQHPGRVALSATAIAFLDGAPPRAIQIVGDAADDARVVVSGAHVCDPAALGPDPLATLSRALGRFALATGPARTATVEALLHQLTAVVIIDAYSRLFAVPVGAGVIVVARREHLHLSTASWPAWRP